MTEPTQEQMNRDLLEFVGWTCRLAPKLTVGMRDRLVWFAPNETPNMELMNWQTPPNYFASLDALFRDIVPKYIAKLVSEKNYTVRYAYETLFQEWMIELEKYFNNGKALIQQGFESESLATACWKAIKGALWNH
jgi:hypothetical protein